MRYTALYGHLESVPDHQIGSIISGGIKIGRMGNTGKSTGAHLHFGIKEGFTANIFRLSDVYFDRELVQQIRYFIDKDLFKTEELVTTQFCDFDYGDPWIMHPGIDVIPRNKDPKYFDIYWNRTPSGIVLGKGTDNGYGNYILVGYET